MTTLTAPLYKNSRDRYVFPAQVGSERDADEVLNLQRRDPSESKSPVQVDHRRTSEILIVERGTGRTVHDIDRSMLHRLENLDQLHAGVEPLHGAMLPVLDHEAVSKLDQVANGFAVVETSKKQMKNS